MHLRTLAVAVCLALIIILIVNRRAASSLKDYALNVASSDNYDNKNMFVSNNGHTVRGMRNNNPGNIEDRANWIGKVPSMYNSDNDKRFAQFYEMKHGVRAAYKLLRNYITGSNSSGKELNTISKIINRWAPKDGTFQGEGYTNHTDEYIKFVSKETGIDPNSVIKPNSEEHANVMIAMFRMENAGQAPTRKQVEEGILLA